MNTTPSPQIAALAKMPPEATPIPRQALMDLRGELTSAMRSTARDDGTAEQYRGEGWDKALLFAIGVVNRRLVVDESPSPTPAVDEYVFALHSGWTKDGAPCDPPSPAAKPPEEVRGEKIGDGEVTKSDVDFEKWCNASSITTFTNNLGKYDLRMAWIAGRHNFSSIDAAPLRVQAAASASKFAQFKSFVNARLDQAGVPAHPNGPHSKEGCRIGDRLDILIGQRDTLVKELAALAAAFITKPEKPSDMEKAQTEAECAGWKVTTDPDLKIWAPDGQLRFHGKNAVMALIHFSMCLQRFDELQSTLSRLRELAAERSELCGKLVHPSTYQTERRIDEITSEVFKLIRAFSPSETGGELREGEASHGN